MSPQIIAQLLAQFGLPLTQQIYTWVKENKTEVTDADWATLTALANYRSADALKATGIQIVEGKVVPA
jgi:hypothetical protein